MSSPAADLPQLGTTAAGTPIGSDAWIDALADLLLSLPAPPNHTPTPGDVAAGDGAKHLATTGIKV